ncbi:uncharacterized protein BDZ83DRAFT_629171 [Colletotrichum acutatum]|uniref:Uncharacterized protein n=1 Tax=Glomerella acutata TaxID=27357 RepID=A0AAD8XF23_GLOAC|nr:uncharacterized protein BDZ83DRAFT_629171 [Colletotrichum acutatum]KAK1722383.1 hypothetical protein BDZ83DRAFT_629171 [Colletotrichum acutatum]
MGTHGIRLPTGLLSRRSDAPDHWEFPQYQSSPDSIAYLYSLFCTLLAVVRQRRGSAGSWEKKYRLRKCPQKSNDTDEAIDPASSTPRQPSTQKSRGMRQQCEVAYQLPADRQLSPMFRGATPTRLIRTASKRLEALPHAQSDPFVIASILDSRCSMLLSRSLSVTSADTRLTYPSHYGVLYLSDSFSIRSRVAGHLAPANVCPSGAMFRGYQD